MKSIFHLLTQLAVISHLLFILFVVFGGLLAFKKQWIKIAHLASFVWAVYAELSPGVICPLTSLENYFGYRAGLSTYDEDFVTRYLIPVIYQEGLTRNIQFILAGIVILINAIVYTIQIRRHRSQAKN
jgi:hypothetical protein